jgi:hypothetical protein
MTMRSPGTASVGPRGVAGLGAACCLALTAVGVLLGGQLAADLSLRAACGVATTAAVLACVAMVVSAPRGVFSLGGIYGLTFLVFHFGLGAVYALGYDPAAGSTAPWSFSWFFAPATRLALVLSATGATGLGAGVCLQALAARRTVPSAPQAEDPGGFPFEFGGFLILAASLLGWLALVVGSGGLALLVGSYSGFLEVTRGTALPLTYFGIGLGLATLVVGRRSRWWRAGAVLFGAWALIAFPLGLRGEVLFPLAGALAVMSLRGRPFSHGRLALLAVALLAVIAAVRVVRQVGLSGGMVDVGTAANPLDALVELGSSLRPVTEVVRWAGDGEPPLLGASYWAPVERLLHYLFPLWERLPSLDDKRLLNVLVMQRAGPIGFSPVAEAYHNFRMAGPAVVMFLVGSLLGWLDRRPVLRRHQALAALVFVPLIIEVRNAFAHVPGQVLAGACTLGGMAALRLAWRRLWRRGGEAPA